MEYVELQRNRKEASEAHEDGACLRFRAFDF